MKLFFNPCLDNQNEKKENDENKIIKRLFLVAFFMTTIGLVIFSKIIEVTILHEKKLIKPSNPGIKDKKDKSKYCVCYANSFVDRYEENTVKLINRVFRTIFRTTI